jgi:hypothetical protein
VAKESSWAAFFRRSSLGSTTTDRIRTKSRMHTNRETLLSSDDGGTGAMSHLINDVESARQSRYKRVTLTTASVITRHMPEPPPVQKRTLFLNMSSLKTAVESTTG